MTCKTYILDPKTRKLVLKKDYVAERHHMIMKPLAPFKSPITGEIITDRGRLRVHNKEHGVTNFADYGPEYFGRKSKEQQAERTGQTPAAKKERIDLIRRAVEQHENQQRR